ncbi:FAS1-like dehydratase domain-containing protein [Donghicola tyrosinivorans]|uniref:3-methylfumaryl-CoA hydratase n=1 Tax=Donghicola tyrosinivorans TaxID=1652492 RepID=A0A2T0WZI1_9RHOB|nr:3-methylfumaryl-CoA hydratase [Donghicola tyrosinivorans]
MADATLQITHTMDPARAQALAVTLEIPAPTQALPPFFHQIYFWEALPNPRLGRDGHPALGESLMPDMGLPRRMWAGGRLQFHRDIQTGIPAEKTSVIESCAHKQGRTGPLAFVTARHEVRQNGQLCVTEWQDIVYREDPSPDQPAPPPPMASEGEVLLERSFSSTDVFRYSALTFNGHRIHYDLDYCRDVEGYSGLVVHGPLLAQVLMLLAKEALGELSEFSFRATAPLICPEVVQFMTDSQGNFWVRGPDGRQCMSASAKA